MTKNEYRIITRFIESFHRDFAVSNDDRLSCALVSDFIDLETIALNSIHSKRIERQLWVLKQEVNDEV